MNIELLDEISKVSCKEMPLTETEKIRIMGKVRRKLPKKKNRLFVVAKAAGALAACYALLIGVSMVNPVFADVFPVIKKLPFAEKLIYSLNHAEGHSYQSPVIRSGAVENYMNTVAGSEDSDFRIVESYCDGTALVLSTVMRVEGVDPAVKYMTPTYNVAINGTPVTVQTSDSERTDLSEYYYNLIRVDDYVFAGSIILDVSGLNLTDTFDLNVKVVSLLGVDNKHFVQTSIFSDTYDARTYKIDTLPGETTARISVDRSLQKTYEVGETQDAVTLNSITASPSSTYVDVTISGENSDDPVAMFLYDSFGNSIPWLKFGFETGKTYYKPLLKDTASVTAKFFRKSDRKNCIAEFIVPVEGGFADIYEPPVESVDTGDVIYEPPLPAPEAGRPANAKVIELGETAVTDRSMSVTYSNMQVFKDIGEAGIPAEDMNDTVYKYYADNEAYRFVTFDVNLRSDHSEGQIIMDQEAEKYEKFDETSKTFWITEYFNPSLINEFYDINNSISRIREAAYFSGAMGGLTNYYHFIMNETDERDFVVGAYVAAEDLENGNFQITIHDSGSSAGETFYVNIPPYKE